MHARRADNRRRSRCCDFDALDAHLAACVRVLCAPSLAFPRLPSLIRSRAAGLAATLDAAQAIDVGADVCVCVCACVCVPPNVWQAIAAPLIVPPVV